MSNQNKSKYVVNANEYKSIQDDKYDVILMSSSAEIYTTKSLREWLPIQCDLKGILHTRDALIQELVNDSAQEMKDTLILVIELEAMGGFVEAFPYLRVIREAYPTVATILLTRETRRNDFTTHRLPICDVTLQIPFSKDDFDVALYAAGKNNVLWQQRAKELQQSE